MSPLVYLAHIYGHFVSTLLLLPRAIRFFWQHRLWQGLENYGWVVRGLVVVGVILGLKLVSVVGWWIGQFTTQSEGLGLSNMTTLVSDAMAGSYHLFTAGFMKYIVLVLLEVLVYHCMRRTLAITINKTSGTRWQDFVEAQVRMIKVVLRSWIAELVLSLIVSVAFGILPFGDFLKAPLIFGIQCYYLGFAVMDNYTEQFGMTIKRSVHYSRQYVGIALALGLMLYIALLVPVVGTLAGPLLVSVTAALAMVEFADLHRHPPVAEPEPED